MSAAGSLHEGLRMARLVDVPTVRAAWWAGVSLRSVRARLPREGLDVRVDPPPALPAHAIRGVEGLLRRVARPSCLERALILQAWLSSRGASHPVIVGVALESGFEAHAWVRGYDTVGDRYSELARVEPH